MSEERQMTGRGRVAVVTVSAVVLLLGGTAAWATSTGSSGGADPLFQEAETSIVGLLIPAVVGLVVIGGLFWLGVQWFWTHKW